MAETMIRKTVGLVRKTDFGDLTILQFSYNEIEISIKYSSLEYRRIFVTGYTNVVLIFLMDAI